MLSLVSDSTAQSAPTAGDNWFSYGGDPGGTHYSSLRQITKSNVSGLKEVWRFETPDTGSIQTTPLIIDGTMYVTSARQKVIALDAATGKQKWIFDSGIGTGAAVRGLTWWSEGKERRLFSAVASYIYAINPADGTVITSFGDHGPHRSAREPARRSGKQCLPRDIAGRGLQGPADPRRSRLRNTALVAGR